MFGARGRIGVVVPANNCVLEPEIWPRLPEGTALHATRILARGALTPEAVRAMEAHFDRAVDELAATGVDAIAYADMATALVMEPGWNEARTAAVAARTGLPCLTAWTALREALAALGAARIAVATPYPAAVHALVAPFFAARGLAVTGHATLDVAAMDEVARVPPGRLAALVGGLDKAGADAVVVLATDLPTFASIEALERATSLPVLSSNQTLLWSALRAVGDRTPIPGLGRLFALR